jgi:enoyl-CoA hydratase
MFVLARRSCTVGQKFVLASRVFFSNGSLNETFQQAVKSIQKGPNSPTPKKEVDNTMKLQLYAYFKQSTDGSCTGERPGMFNLVDRAKYDAWKGLGSMTKDQAQQKYIDIVKDIFGGDLPKLSNASESTKEETKAPSAPKNEANSHAGSKPNYSGRSYNSWKDVAFPRKKNQTNPSFETVLNCSNEQGVGFISLNRPTRGNAFNFQMWEELRQSFNYFSSNAATRVIILNGSGNSFSTGMDLSVFMDIQSLISDVPCEARKREHGLYNMLNYFHEIISSPENCPVPVIAAIHGNCIGGAVDLVCATDLRYCTKDTTFCVKETDLAMVADIGTLQRLPKLIGTQKSMELTYTARNFSGVEAEAMGLVVKAFDSKEEMMKHVNEMAVLIAKKSPLTIRGVKKTILYTRDHTVEDSLNQVKLWNSAFLYSNDLAEAAMAMMSKKEPEFKED